MRKRPLCMVCIALLLIQAIRVWMPGGGRDSASSALETALECAFWEEESQELVLSGKIDRLQEKENTVAVEIRAATVFYHEKKYREKKLILYLKKEERSSLHLGNQLLASGTGGTFEVPGNPGEFHLKQYYYARGIHVFVHGERFRVTDAGTDRLKERLSHLREMGVRELKEQMGERQGGIMGAVLFGEKSALEEDTKLLYQKNGIGHILVISGLHMSFLGVGLYRILRKGGVSFFHAALLSGTLLFLYTILVGGGISAGRAWIMFLVKMGAEVSGREYDLPTSLSLAGALLSLANPLCLLDAGFFLSFGAVAGLLLAGPVCGELGGSRIWKALASSLSVNLFLMGPVLSCYYEVPVYAALLNLMVIPLLPAAVGSGLVGLVLLPVWDAASRGGFALCGCIWNWYDVLCSLFQRLPGSRLVTGKPGFVWLTVYYAGVLSLCLLFYKEKARTKKTLSKNGKKVWIPGIVLLLFSSVMVLGCRAACCRLPKGELEVLVLDVGQGDGILLRLPTGENYLVDGGSSDKKEVGKRQMEPCLLSLGIRELDGVFVTHGDQDHVNGISQLLERQDLGVRIRALYLPEQDYWDETIKGLEFCARAHGTKTKIIREGDQIKRKNGFSMVCLAPFSGGEMELGNEASLVLRFQYGDVSMLLTGDIGKKTEQALAERGIGSVTILKAAHHGSKSSSSEAFLKRLTPRITVISAGVKNRYSHPDEEVLQRLRKGHSQIVSTQEMGALSICTDGKHVQVSGFLRKRKTGEKGIHQTGISTEKRLQWEMFSYIMEKL